MGEILVTGGAGFIGTHTCIALLQAGYSVVILDNLCNAKQESLLHLQEITGKSIPFYHMDIRNADGLRQIFQTHHISAVLHFAGLKAVGESVQQPLRYYQNNIGGMMTLLEELQKTDCRTLIFSSSATVYGTQHTPMRKPSHHFPQAIPTGKQKSSANNSYKTSVRQILTGTLQHSVTSIRSEHMKADCWEKNRMVFRATLPLI